MATELTPCGALFETMKRYGGISHKDLARLVLSGRPLADGKSPLSRCDDRTWVSRFIVHAPVGSLQDRYFCDWGVAALRVSARLRSRDGKGLSAEEALSLVTDQGGALMEQALRECHQDLALYRNVLERLARGAGYSVEERAELAMVLFVAAGCSANVKRACAYVLDYVKTVHGGRLETVPAYVMDSEQPDAPSADPREQAQALGLLRMVGGLVSGGGCTGCSRFPTAWRSARWPWGLTTSTMWSPMYRAIICASGATRRADGACRAWEAPTAPC